MHQALVEYCLNAVWQIPLVAAGAVAVARIGGLPPGGRNLVWLAFLAMAVVSPALPMHRPAPAHEMTQSPAAVSAGPVEAADAAPPASDANPWRLLRIGLDGRSASLIKLAFASVAGFALARLALAGLAARRLVRESGDLTLAPAVAEALERACAEHGRTPPPVRQSPLISSPVVVGAFRPVILTPEGFTRHAEGEQQAALLHEFAHVLRHDYAVNLLCELAALPVCWHPAVHAIKAGVRRTRELACDAIASAAMGSPEIYARRLLSLAKALGAPAIREPSSVLVGLFGKSDLEERLMHLMTPRGAEGRAFKTVRLAGAGLLAAGLLAPALLFRVTPALAEAQPYPASSAPASSPAPATPVDKTASAAAAEAAHDAAPSSPAVGTRRRHADRPRIARLAQPVVDPAASAHERTAALPAPPTPPAPAHELSLAPPAPPAPPTPPAPPAPPNRTAFGLLIDDSGHVTWIHSVEQERRLKETVARAMARATAAQRAVESAEFKQRLADIGARQKEIAAADAAKIQREVDAAFNDARVQAALARAQEKIASAAMREGRRQAEEARREVERSMRELAPLERAPATP